jgi:hypothetical protein
MIWIQMLRTRQIEIGGQTLRAQAGDWLEVGRAQARRWQTSGDAVILQPHPLMADGAAGIVAWQLPRVDSQLVQLYNEYITTQDTPALLYAHTILIRSSDIMPEMLPVGLDLLARWECAAPIVSYELTAQQIGTAADCRRLQSAIIDLRVPVYNTKLLIMRRCAVTQELLTRWRALCLEYDHDDLAFSQALYEIKPLFCALPTCWIKS